MAAANVLALLRLVGSLDETIALEQSFKATHGRLLPDRLLLGLNRRTADRDTDIASVCMKLGMPHNLLASFTGRLPDANHVYFGVEKNEQTLIYKAYLELRDKIEKEMGGSAVAGGSYRLFTGFKWDSSFPSRQAVTRYDWFPNLPAVDMLGRLKIMIDGARHERFFDIVRALAERIAAKTSHRDIQYLEVTEEGNPRRSFDINVYKAGYRLEDVCSFLLTAAEHYAIPSATFDSLYERIKTEPFGHVAGGIDRDGKDFTTIYYGVRHVHSAQLQTAAIVPGDPPRAGQ